MKARIALEAIKRFPELFFGECEQIEYPAAVPLGGGFAVGVALRSGTRDRRESAVDAVDRRAVHPDAVLRDPEDDSVAVRARVRGQCETDPSADVADGTGGDLSETAAVGSWARASHLSVSSGSR
jgi:hypothetical protein